MSDGKWKIDLSGWTTMEPILNWQEAARSGNLPAMTQIMMEAVQDWPFDGDPSARASYGALTPQQWKEAAEVVGEKIAHFFLGEVGIA